MDSEQFVKAGGRFLHYRSSAQRRITVAYRVENGNILYGAEIHQPDGPDDCWIRKQANYRALYRLISQPVTIPDGNMTNTERHSYIRSALIKFGCCQREVLSVNKNIAGKDLKRRV